MILGGYKSRERLCVRVPFALRPFQQVTCRSNWGLDVLHQFLALNLFIGRGCRVDEKRKKEKKIQRGERETISRYIVYKRYTRQTEREGERQRRGQREFYVSHPLSTPTLTANFQYRRMRHPPAASGTRASLVDQDPVCQILPPFAQDAGPASPSFFFPDFSPFFLIVPLAPAEGPAHEWHGSFQRLGSSMHQLGSQSPSLSHMEPWRYTVYTHHRRLPPSTRSVQPLVLYTVLANQHNSATIHTYPGIHVHARPSPPSFRLYNHSPTTHGYPQDIPPPSEPGLSGIRMSTNDPSRKRRVSSPFPCSSPAAN